jgi:ATP phosphoribosyltransferase regulatory subunit
MTIDTAVLTNEEKISFALRSLYHRRGYAPYRMSRFEEYELYMKNKDFLRAPEVITFTDVNGKLMALKPDVTLSIVRASRPG